MTESYNYLGKPEWAPHWHRTVRSVPEYGIAAKYVPWILPTLKAIPPSWVAVADPGMGMVLGYYKACEAKIREIMNDKERSIEKAKQKMSTLPTLFHELLDANLPPEEKSFARLSEECQSIVGAGTETTAHALEVICFHLLDNPDKLQKLREELDHLNPDRKATIPLCELEKLPYLVCLLPSLIGSLLTFPVVVCCARGITVSGPRQQRYPTNRKEQVLINLASPMVSEHGCSESLQRKHSDMQSTPSRQA